MMGARPAHFLTSVGSGGTPPFGMPTSPAMMTDETMRAVTDIIDTERSIRLEWTIVALIVVEVLIAFYGVFARIAT